MKLGKTKDSRTRRKPTLHEDSEVIRVFKSKVKSEEEFVDYLLMKGFSTRTIKGDIKNVNQFKKWLKEQNLQEE